MTRFRAISIAAVALSLSATTLAQQQSGSKQVASAAKQEIKPEPATQNAQQVSPDYVIGTEDVLVISVWREPEISRTVPVRPDGKVSLPLIGELQAKGFTPMQLQNNLTLALRSYIANPEVTVIVQEVHSQKFNILGEVAKPGSYPLSKPTTVVDALAIAGGFRDFAKVKKIYVLRLQADGSRQRIPFNYKRVVQENRFEQNVELQPHDTIVVP